MRLTCATLEECMCAHDVPSLLFMFGVFFDIDMWRILSSKSPPSPSWPSSSMFARALMPMCFVDGCQGLPCISSMTLAPMQGVATNLFDDVGVEVVSRA